MSDSDPAHGEHVKPKEWSDEKLAQRKEVADAIKNHKTILELFAGEGNISEVYAGRGKRHILVDDEKAALKKAKAKVKNAETFAMKNGKWMEENLPEIDDITLVDFDPYGSPTDAIKQFFSLYKVREPMAVAITDGQGVNLMNWESAKLWEQYELSEEDAEAHYKERIPELNTSLMQALGKKHGFTVDGINGLWGGSGRAERVYYSGYVVKPTKKGKDSMISCRKLGFDRALLDDKIVSEDDDSVVFGAVIAREMVQPYPEGMAYKPADELEKAAWTADGRWLTTEKHPDTQLLIRREDIKGRVENPKFVKDLLEPKTKRPMDRGIRADLRFFKKHISPQILTDIKNGALRDVSIGFLYDEDKTLGEWNGQKYDFVQRNIFIDHVAAAVPVGRCPSPYCGIGIDELGKVKDMKIGLDPWEETENFIRSGHRSPDDFDPDSLRTIDITEGVRAIVACPKGKYEGGKCSVGMEVQSYLFDVKKFTMAQAKAWFEDHKAKGDAKNIREVDEENVFCVKCGKEANYWMAMCKGCSDKLVEVVGDCPICDEIKRLGNLEFSMRLVRTFGKDTILKAVKDQEDVCGNCANWKPSDGTCSVKEGEFSKDDTCDDFKAKEVEDAIIVEKKAEVDQVERARKLIQLL